MPLSNISVRVLLHFQLPELRFATWCRSLGATTSLFPYDERMADYLKATGRRGSGIYGYCRCRRTSCR